MLYTFGRVGAVVAMRVKDYAPASAGKKVLCLREKGGKRHRVPVHHKLRERMDEYLSAAGIEGEDEAPLFQSAGRSKELTGRQLNRRRAWDMVKRRAHQAGIEKDISPHSMRRPGLPPSSKMGASWRRPSGSPPTRIRGPSSSTTGATSGSSRRRSNG
jgi:site-specific recombinase XerD